MAHIFNIRGTGGSGKSYIVVRMIKELGIKKKIKKDGKVIGYRLNGDVVVVGRYDTDCGGCDGIKSQGEITERVTKFADKGKVVVFEGLLVSGLYSRFLNLSKDLKQRGHKYTWVFLDTPPMTCLHRTIERRKKSGNKKEFDPYHTVVKYRAVQNAMKRAPTDGENVVVLNHKKSYSEFMKLIGPFRSVLLARGSLTP